MNKTNGDADNDLDFSKASHAATCLSCPFWHARDDLKQGDGVQGGECRFNPPGIFEVTVETRLGKAKGFQSVWPIVGSGNWCAKHPERDFPARAVMFESFKELLEKAGVIAR